MTYLNLICFSGSDGCLGFAMTRKLSSMGYTVYAAVKNLDEEIINKLNKLGNNVHPVSCDVIKYKDVSEAAKYISRNLGTKSKLLIFSLN